MIPTPRLAALLLLGCLVPPALAAERTVTLSVPGMYCAVCPITVKKALQKVPGVVRVQVSFEKKEAVVTYDDTRATEKALEDATFEAGYVSTVKGGPAK